MSARKPAIPRYSDISEAVFTAHVIELARWHGWLAAHFRPGMDRHGKWKTAVQGDGVGFPDCVLIKPGRVIFAELKAAKGKVTPEQEVWLQAAKNAGIEAYCWRPSMIEEIEGVLK